nr:MAG TPA: hypothetical protein [Caudoviricetes sp.]
MKSIRKNHLLSKFRLKISQKNEKFSLCVKDVPLTVP